MRAKHKIQRKSKYRSPSTYFSHYTEPTGLNADIARHDVAIASLQASIDKTNDPRVAEAYRQFIRLCKDSRAKLTELL